jgi:hypothetical protein
MHLPGPVRAVVGLIADAADEAKHLPERAVELPMMAVSTAMQLSIRAQQQYVRLAARGDEVLQRRTTTDDPPEWATFDEPVDEPMDADGAVGVVGIDVTDPETLSAPSTDESPESGLKGVNTPRHTAPSRFDAVGDDSNPGSAPDERAD